MNFDNKNIYVYNWWTTKTYALKDVKAIKEGDFGSLDPFFQIEIWDKDGTIIKVDFMPKALEEMTFFFTKKYSGQLEYFRDQITRSKRIE